MYSLILLLFRGITENMIYKGMIPAIQNADVSILTEFIILLMAACGNSTLRKKTSASIPDRP